MKIRTKRFRIGLLALFVLALTFLGTSWALAENVTILTVSDDQLESMLDEKGISLRETIEAFTRALEARGDTVHVLGNKGRNGNALMLVYPDESGNFNWTIGETGKNQDNYIRTLEQLAATEFSHDRVVIFTGFLANRQRSNQKALDQLDDQTPVIVYGCAPMPGGKAQTEAYQEAIGRRLQGDGAEDSQGFHIFQNTAIKETESFDAEQVLNDLLAETFGWTIEQSGDEIKVPDVLASRAVLMTEGDKLGEVSFVLNGNQVYQVVTDRSSQSQDTLLGSLIPWADRQKMIVEIPEGMGGSLKISSTSDVTAKLYCMQAEDYAQRLENIQICPAGIEYAEDGSVVLNLSNDPVVQELKMIYPGLSYQAQIMLLDSAQSETLYSEDQNQITWNKAGTEKAEITVFLRDTRDGKELIPSQKIRYTPIVSMLEDMEAVISVRPAEKPGKREKIQLVMTIPETEDQAVNLAVSNWLSGAEAIVTDRTGAKVAEMIFDPGKREFISQEITTPDHSGEYRWQITLRSGESYLIDWSTTFDTQAILLENHAPLAHKEVLDTAAEQTMKPGDSFTVKIPGGLFTDPDHDPLSVHYSGYFGEELLLENTFVCEDGETEAFDIPGLDRFGNWDIRLAAEDNEKESSEEIRLEILLSDSNHSPQVDETILQGLEMEVSKSIMPGESTAFSVPAGLYADPDGDPVTIHYTVFFNNELQSEGSAASEDGASSEVKIEGLDQFGQWTIEMSAEDIYHAPGQKLTFTVKLHDGNTEPHFDSQKKPAKDRTVSILNFDDFQLAFERGMFVDDENDNLTVYVTIVDPSNRTEEYTFKGKDGVSSTWNYTPKAFGPWQCEVYATDENGKKSEVYAFRVVIEDAIPGLPGLLSVIPEHPEKGDLVRFLLKLDWQEQYQELQIREYLGACTVSLTDNYGESYEMKLSEETLSFESDEITMPYEETELTYTAVVKSGEKAEPEREFADFNKVEIQISNSAPFASAGSLPPETRYLLDLKDYELPIPAGIFTDAENDDYTVLIEIMSQDGNVSQALTINGTETASLRFSDFGSWTVRLTATDKEGSSSEPLVYAAITLHNLKMIIMVAGAALAVLMAALIVILRIRHKKNMPKYNPGDKLMFTFRNEKGKEETVSMDMPVGDTESFPLSLFVVGIPVLLNDGQWNSLKKWKVCPTKGDRPELRPIDSKNSREDRRTEMELEDGLKVSVINS